MLQLPGAWAQLHVHALSHHRHIALGVFARWDHPSCNWNGTLKVTVLGARDEELDAVQAGNLEANPLMRHMIK